MRALLQRMVKLTEKRLLNLIVTTQTSNMHQEEILILSIALQIALEFEGHILDRPSYMHHQFMLMIFVELIVSVLPEVETRMMFS